MNKTKRNVIALVTGMIIPAFSAFSLPKITAVKAEDTTEESEIIEESKTIYIDLSETEEFLNEDGDPYLHYKNSEDANLELELVENGIYSCLDIPLNVLDTATYGFEVINYEGGELKTAWLAGDNKLALDTYNYIYINSELEVAGYGYYAEKTPNPKQATYKTQRIWLNDNRYQESGYKPALGYFEDDVYKVVLMLSELNSFDSLKYHYADIPENISEVHFLKFDGDYLIVRDEMVNLSYGVCYQFSDDSISTCTVYNATANLLAFVVEAYLTYGKNPSNGATNTTMKNVYTTFFANKSATQNDLKNVKISDYTGYAANGNSYEGLEKNSQFSVNEKWNTMCSNAGINPNTGASTANFGGVSMSTTKLLLLVGGALVGVICIFILYEMLKKKRKVE